MSTANKLTYLNGTKQAIKQAINEDFEVVYDKGKNLFDGVLELGNFNTNTGEKVANNDYIINTNPIPVEELTNYKISSNGTGIRMYVFEYKEDMTYNLSSRKTVNADSYLTTNSGTKYINFRTIDANTNLQEKIQVEKGSTATDYEPYVEETTFREYADEISSNNAKYKDLIPKETTNATNTLDISNSSGLDKALVTQYGNTYQETTTGKNLFDNVYGQTGNVYTKHINAPSPLGSVDCYPINLLPNTQYTLKIDMNGYQKTGAWIAGVCFENGDVISLLQLNSMEDITTTTFTTDSTGVVYVGQRYGFTYGETGRMDLFLQTAKIQLEKGSTATDYEPYTNGASPNPDYPQEIVNISGKSTLKDVGKNLYDYDNNTDYSTYYLNNEGDWMIDGSSNYINQKINITSNIISIYIGAKTGGAYIRLGQFKSDGTFITRTLINGSTNNVTLNSNCSYIWLSTNKDSSTYFENVSVIYGNSISAYEPYQEQSFDLDLKSKNLLPYPYPDTTKTSNGITFTELGNGIIRVNGTATARTSFTLYGAYQEQNNLPIIGNYIIGGSLNVHFYVWNHTGNNYNLLADDTGTGTAINKGTYNKCYMEIVVQQGVSVNNELIKPMVLDSLDDTNFEPFYDINLCKIGTYKDRIYKSTGKNLWGEEEHGGIDESTGQDVYNANRWRTKNFISVKSNTQYTLSSDVSNNIFYIFYYYDENYTFISSNAIVGLTSATDTTPNNCKYMRCVIADTGSIKTSKRQVEKGSTATTYEGYGKKWYLEKKIGKVVLNGSELWNVNQRTSGYQFDTQLNEKKAGSNTIIEVYSNYFTGTYFNNRDNILNSIYTGNNDKSIRILTNIESTTTNFKTWLSTHNLEVYYALATPTTEEITESNYPTLYNQLNNIKLFEGVNHITLTNESGLDVEFDITYYKDWKLD